MNAALPNPLYSILFPLALGLLFLLIALALFKRDSKKRLIGVCVSLFVFLVTFTLLEAGWYLFYAESDNINRTFASRRWFKKYWKPINPLGFRDIEFKSSDFTDKKILFVVGDSFVAGHGLKDPKDRFSDLLRNKLGDTWAVLNVGKTGWNTFNQSGAIDGVSNYFKIKPSVVILSYYVNDISDLRYLLNKKSPIQAPKKIADNTSAPIKFLRDHSYFCNYLFWTLFRADFLEEISKSRWYQVTEAYDDEAIWVQHKADLLGIVKKCKSMKAALIVLIFPNLTDIPGTSKITYKVADLLRKQGVPVLDLGVLLKDRDPSELVVSSRDTHPNGLLNKEISELLLKEIKGLKK